MIYNQVYEEGSGQLCYAEFKFNTGKIILISVEEIEEFENWIKMKFKEKKLGAKF